MTQYCFLLFKERVCRKCASRGTTTRVHFAYYTQGHAAAHKHAKKKNYKMKDYNVK